jgi:hypothetical protein
MTVSALSALVLRDWLNQSKRPSRLLPNSDSKPTLNAGKLLPSRFQKSLARSNALHWGMATGQDSRFLTTAGRSESGWLMGVMQWYTERLLLSANQDAAMHTFLLEIAHLLKSPLAVYHPKIVLRVLATDVRTLSQSKSSFP